MKPHSGVSDNGVLRFGEFSLDPANRRLQRGADPIELGGRYIDALIMLASAPGQLISKERLHDEVWRGVPVTDEALSQAIMALRKALGDDAARPRFIETVRRHGYRFIGMIDDGASPVPAKITSRAETLVLVTQGTVGAIVAGLVVGVTYGIGATGAGAGSALSLVMVLICVSVLAAMVSGLGVAGGIAFALRHDEHPWWLPVAGGAVGGLLVGGFARLVGIDTLRLLMGVAPDRMAGAAEGMVMGAVVGLGYSMLRGRAVVPRLALVALLGGTAGAALVGAGGTLMAGSLSALVTRFPAASLSMGWTDSLLLRLFSGVFEGAVFASLVCVAMAVKRR